MDGKQVCAVRCRLGMREMALSRHHGIGTGICLIKQDFDEVFKKVDVIASPTAPTTAFKIGDNINDPLQMYLNDIYTISANLAGICAINVPAGTHSNGLPYGMQFMGDTFQESKILSAAAQIENLNNQ